MKDKQTPREGLGEGDRNSHRGERSGKGTDTEGRDQKWIVIIAALTRILEILRMIPTKRGTAIKVLDQGDTKTKLHGNRRTGRMAKPSTTASEHTSKLNDGTNWW